MTAGGGGRVQRDDAPAIDLPPDTLFLARYAAAVIEQARSGTHVAQYVILGGAFERPWTARIAVQPAPDAPVPRGSAIDPSALGGRSWRILTGGAEARDLGDYAMEAWLFESGVAAEYLWRDRGFAIQGRLESARGRAAPELLTPGC
jgi:hypothetical protein